MAEAEHHRVTSVQVGLRSRATWLSFGSGGRHINMLWLRTLLFTLLVPGTVLGVAPLALVTGRWGSRFNLGAPHWIGFALVLPGVAMIVWCFIDFIRRGHGTPAPYDPPRRLVILGLYRRVRNPQYVGVVLVALGEAILSGRTILFVYAGFLAISYHLFVRLYEEPTLRRTFGEEYVRYCAVVPRWLPLWSSFAEAKEGDEAA